MATESLTQAVRERLKSLEAQWLNNRKERARLAEEADQLMYAITVIKDVSKVEAQLSRQPIESTSVVESLPLSPESW